jgi:hypothetical protein
MGHLPFLVVRDRSSNPLRRLTTVARNACTINVQSMLRAERSVFCPDYRRLSNIVDVEIKCIRTVAFTLTHRQQWTPSTARLQAFISAKFWSAQGREGIFTRPACIRFFAQLRL